MAEKMPEPVRYMGHLVSYGLTRDDLDHAAYLINRYPDLEAEVERLKRIRVPEIFLWEADE
jgi:hypothetical protein